MNPWEQGAPPKVRNARIFVAITWVASGVGVVLAIGRSDWLVGAYAFTTAIASAGWFTAIGRWASWRRLAIETLAASSILLRREGDQ